MARAYEPDFERQEDARNACEPEEAEMSRREDRDRIRSEFSPDVLDAMEHFWRRLDEIRATKLDADEERNTMPMTKSDVAWLIELPQEHRSGPPEYWSAVDHDGDRNIYGWDRDVKHAMRFATEKAAQAYIDVFAIEHAVAVEHAWV